LQITINGEQREVASNITLLELLESLGITDKVMAAAINMQIVKKEAWKEHHLVEGDTLELLDFVGGG